ncbi:hypothetical protein GCM10007391_06120 [Alteromonas halophila]|uniref:Fructosamine kinase family protein n=2 Tax=Alteromonas halophila TaxID=516698 RepID=A0A918JEI2_9ALTE|nr:hypothetical protein GCM10007391_06120 [Alteromonas halophila]
MVTATMWHFISEQISSALDMPFICQHQKMASGGDTHQCFVIRDERHRFFVKIHPLEASKPLKCEAEGLSAMAAIEGVSVPRVIACGDVHVDGRDIEYLVLSHLRFQPSVDTATLYGLGKMVARLHQANGYAHYGWDEDNFIGASVQENGWYENWADFFAEKRIGSMLERFSRKGMMITDNDVLVNSVHQQLSSHHPAPSLLHGDLWSGNAGATNKGPVLYDPAVYVGDAETDLAMTELFGGFGEAFYEGYRSEHAIADGYAARKPIYQLYHILNHALLFGSGYANQAKSLISQIQHS